METNYLTLIAAALLVAAGSAGATYLATDQSDTLADQGDEIESLTTQVTELETQIDAYQTTVADLQSELDAAETRADDAEAELARYVQPVEADYSSTYEVNRTQDAEDQRVEDEFTVTVNEATDELELELGYSLEEDSSIDGADTVTSLTVYDGDYKVGEYKGDNWDNSEAPETYLATVETKDNLEEFSGDYTVEVEHDFDIAGTEPGFEVLDVEFTATDTSDYYIYQEEK